MVLIFIAIVLLLSFLLRILLVRIAKLQGCDAYFFLLCAEEYKKNRKIRIVLPPLYLLEPQEQWYPPGFAIFLSLIPTDFLKRYFWLISPILDSLTALTAFIIAFLLTKNIWAGFASGIFYSIAISAIEETLTLTSRPLGSMLFSLTLLSAIAFSQMHNYMYLVPFFVCGYLMLMTHKLSSQAFYVLMPCLSIFLLNPIFMYLCISLILLTLFLSKGFYFKILLAHFDIVRFWRKNNAYLFSHPIYDSPLYLKYAPKGFNRHRYHKAGLINMFRPPLYLVIKSPALVCAFISIGVLWNTHINQFSYSLMFLCWIVVVPIFGMLTIWIPTLRGLGEGDKYFRFIALPSSIAAVIPIGVLDKNNPFYLPYIFMIILALVCYCVPYGIFVLKYKKSKILIPEHDRDNLAKMFNHIKSLSSPRLMVLPYHLYDSIAYHCRVPVLWGTHGFGFKNIADYFPVLQKPIDYFIEKYKINYMVVDSKYVDFSIFNKPFNNVTEFDNFRIYEL